MQFFMNFWSLCAFSMDAAQSAKSKKIIMISKKPKGDRIKLPKLKWFSLEVEFSLLRISVILVKIESFCKLDLFILMIFAW